MTPHVQLEDFRIFSIHIDADLAYEEDSEFACNVEYFAETEITDEFDLTIELRLTVTPDEGVVAPFTQLKCVGAGVFTTDVKYERAEDVPDEIATEATGQLYDAIRVALLASTASMPNGPYRLGTRPIDPEGWVHTDIEDE